MSLPKGEISVIWKKKKKKKKLKLTCLIFQPDRLTLHTVQQCPDLDHVFLLGLEVKELCGQHIWPDLFRWCRLAGCLAVVLCCFLWLVSAWGNIEKNGLGFNRKVLYFDRQTQNIFCANYQYIKYHFLVTHACRIMRTLSLSTYTEQHYRKYSVHVVIYMIYLDYSSQTEHWNNKIC